MSETKTWSFSVGELRRPHRVTVFENTQRDNVLALRWFVDTPRGRKAKYESLDQSLRTKNGKIIKEMERWAKAQAQAKHDALARGDVERDELADQERAVADREAAMKAVPLTIGEAKALVVDAKKGKYPTKSQHRRETESALDFAVATWGKQRSWNSLRKGDLRALARARIEDLHGKGHDGLAGAEHTVQRVLTVAQWLRDEELIEPGACTPSKTWKDELRTYWLETSGRHEIPKPHQPRHTIAEAFKIIAAAHQIDPRLELVLVLAPNQRMKQVARLHRSNIDLDQNLLRIPSRGKKKGALIALTQWERDTLNAAFTTGYLRELERLFQAGDVPDYPIFPAGPMHGGRLHRAQRTSVTVDSKTRRPPDVPVARLGYAPQHRANRGDVGIARYTGAAIVTADTIRDWFEEAEKLAKVDKVEGRGPYGLRRAFTQAGKDEKLSREGLTALGGWADPQMADRVYADEEQIVASHEARDFRERLQDRFINAHATATGNEHHENDQNVQPTKNTANPEIDRV